MTHRLRIGTRGSRLARWQADWVARALRAIYQDLLLEIVEIKTQGDRDRNSPLSAIGGTGLFTKEIQRALCDGAVDIAVHSLKDLPTTGPEELVVAAVPARETIADALVSPKYRTLDELPPGASVGTGSLRRRAQLLYLRPDLQVVPVRGNVETRLARASDDTVDSIVVALAGLTRLGLEAHVTELLAPPRLLPAVGQGALGIECRRDDHETTRLLSPLNDTGTFAAVTAERTLLAELEGGCLVPLGAWGRVSGDTLVLDAAVFDVDGRERVAGSIDGLKTDAAALGKTLAERLRDQGADSLLQTVRSKY
jgi:hydroxymethylbilane synthase